MGIPEKKEKICIRKTMQEYLITRKLNKWRKVIPKPNTDFNYI
jgi:hypothetical protein